jgi:transcriptional regulator with XRE-family HTH domain
MDAAKRFSKALGKALTAGLSKAELSRRTGIARDLIDHYLSGETIPGLIQAERIANACGNTIEQFLSGGPKVKLPEMSTKEALRVITKAIRDAGL